MAEKGRRWILHMQRDRKRAVWETVRYSVLMISVLFIGVGILNQEYREVLQKAVRICLECIGIG